MKTRSLSRQLIIGSILVITTMIVMFSLMISFLMVQNVMDVINKKKEMMSLAYQEKVDHYLEGPANAILTLAERLETLEADNRLDEAVFYLDSILATFPYLDALRICNAEGDVIYGLPNAASGEHSNLAYEDFFQEWPKRGKVSWSSLFIAKDGSPSMSLTTATDQYLIIASLNIGELHDRFAINYTNNRVSASVVNKHGIYMVSEDKADVMTRKRHPEFTNLLKALERGEQSLTAERDRSTVLSIASLDVEEDWYLILEYDRGALYWPVVSGIIEVIAAALLVLGIAIYWIRRTTNKVILEIQDLNQAAVMIAEGEYGHSLNHYVFSEYESLSLSISRIAQAVQLRESQILEVNSTLEHAVEQRTEELIQSNSQLQELNAQLEEEISERHRIEEELRSVNDNLYVIVEDRTREIVSTNEDLKATNSVLAVKETDLQHALQKAQDAIEEKGRFIADVSHEIRTPLNGLIGVMTALGQTALDDRQSELIKALNSCSEALISVINDVLDYSRIESGKLSLNEQPIAIREVTEDAVGLFKYSAQDKGIELLTDYSGLRHHQLLADGPRIRQILFNLLSNAVKFTDQGQVQLSATSEVLGPEEALLRLVVKDTGIGISPEDIPFVFDRYKQSKTSSNRPKGSGLGLAIAKKLAQIMGGDITVTSQLGVGSAFEVQLRLKAEEVSDLSEVQVQVLERLDNSISCKLLAAEDDAVSLMVLKSILEKKGFDVFGATNGLEVMAAIENNSYDLILLDINMPLMDGLETIRQIRGLNNPGVSSIPVIAMTAYTLNGDRERFIQAGMTDYISKPLNYEQLFRMIEKYVGQRVDSEAAERHRQEADNAISLSELIASLTAASGLDEAQCRFIVEAFVNQSKQLLSMLAVALEQQKSEELRKLLHQLKGSAGNVRAKHIHSLATEGEQAAEAQLFGQMEGLIAQISIEIQALEEALEEVFEEAVEQVLEETSALT